MSAARSELKSQGWATTRTQPCKRCGTEVEVWTPTGDPSSKPVYINTDQHPTGPGLLHTWTCGEQLPGPLPPVPEQTEERLKMLKERGNPYGVDPTDV